MRSEDPWQKVREQTVLKDMGIPQGETWTKSKEQKK